MSRMLDFLDGFPLVVVKKIGLFYCKRNISQRCSRSSNCFAFFPAPQTAPTAQPMPSPARPAQRRDIDQQTRSAGCLLMRGGRKEIAAAQVNPVFPPNPPDTQCLATTSPPTSLFTLLSHRHHIACRANANDHVPSV